MGVMQRLPLHLTEMYARVLRAGLGSKALRFPWRISQHYEC